VVYGAGAELCQQRGKSRLVLVLQYRAGRLGGVCVQNKERMSGWEKYKSDKIPMHIVSLSYCIGR
jgi:hypothetical protein